MDQLDADWLAAELDHIEEAIEQCDEVFKASFEALSMTEGFVLQPRDVVVEPTVSC